MTYHVTCGTASATADVTVLPAGFFMAASGSSDSNAGDMEHPVATFQRCKTLVDSSGTNKTCYLRGGTYTPTSTFNFGNNEYFSVYPPDGIASAAIDASKMSAWPIFHCYGCSNAAIYGLDFTKATTAAPCTTCAAILVEDSANNVYIDENSFDFSTIGRQYLLYWNSSNFYFRGNTMTQPAVGQSPNPGGCGVAPFYCNNTSWNNDDGATHSGIHVLNNHFNGCINACVETGGTAGSVADHFHIDWNTFENYQGLLNPSQCSQNAFAAISHIAPGNVSTGDTNGTVWGNTFSVTPSQSSCIWAVEAVAPVTYASNTCTAGNGVCFYNSSSNNQSVGAAFLNNTITTQTNPMNPCDIGNHTCGLAIHSPVNGEWIGTNTIDGVQVAGCSSTGSPSWCGGAPYANPSTPALSSPAAQYTGSFP